MSNGTSATAAQLGTIGLGTDNHPKGLSPKLDSVGTDPDERFYMLATYCFDLSRKLKYISLALEPFWDSTKPEDARRIKHENEVINPPDEPELPWKERAQRAEDVMKKLWSELEFTYHHSERLAERASNVELPPDAFKPRASLMRV
jgi:hypothetical protein